VNPKKIAATTNTNLRWVIGRVNGYMKCATETATDKFWSFTCFFLPRPRHSFFLFNVQGAKDSSSTAAAFAFAIDIFISTDYKHGTIDGKHDPKVVELLNTNRFALNNNTKR
jgi:hypothetical protein